MSASALRDLHLEVLELVRVVPPADGVVLLVAGQPREGVAEVVHLSSWDGHRENGGEKTIQRLPQFDQVTVEVTAT